MGLSVLSFLRRLQYYILLCACASARPPWGLVYNAVAMCVDRKSKKKVSQL
jgi:hypothetical protein